ncbi:arginine--tRNA ligase [Oxyplasma meridianum]|uniref:Arginine--tRNA ligase n=1 Tax=Oxyplasma meridianum TaxID=3073602 RepID=A0AAX4NJ01_9ARCH
MLLFEDYRAKITDDIKTVYADLDPSDVGFDRTGHADFAFRTFRVAKSTGNKGEEIFSKVSSVLSGKNYIESVSLEGPYINIRINPSTILRDLDESVEIKGQFPDTFQDPERVSVEHTSTNPTGPLHVGRIRNTLLGDSIARILARYGYRVTTQYFVNDSGRQIMALYEAYRRYSSGKKPDMETILWGYQRIYAEMDKDPTIENDIRNLMNSYENGDLELMDKIKAIASVALDNINRSLKSLDVKIDDYTWESDFIRSGELAEIIESFSEFLKDEDSAKYILNPDEEKIFLIRGNGTSLYFTRDIAYHKYKARTYDWIIDILGEDHKGHAKNLQFVLKDLMDLPNRIDFVFNAYVSLETGKMSTRKGNAVTVDELLERTKEEALKIVSEKRPDLPREKLESISRSVAKSSIRFNIIRINASKQVVFKWSEALNFEGDSAPYIMYSYARSCGILKHAGNAKPNYENIVPQERDLIVTMYQYPYRIIEAKDSLRPDIIANYTLDLVKKFNEFYRECPVSGSDEKTMGKRIRMVQIYKNIIEDISKILGIELLEEM